jgi:hypothetical protein
MGNRQTRKAGGYVKELCRVVEFALDKQTESGEPVLVVNFSMDPPATLESFVESICASAGFRRRPLHLPRSVLMGVSYAVDAVAHLCRIRQPINPVRMRKLFRSTNIEPRWLRAHGYRYQYTLTEAFADWKKDCPQDFV